MFQYHADCQYIAIWWRFNSALKYILFIEIHLLIRCSGVHPGSHGWSEEPSTWPHPEVCLIFRSKKAGLKLLYKQRSVLFYCLDCYQCETKGTESSSRWSRSSGFVPLWVCFCFINTVTRSWTHGFKNTLDEQKFSLDSWCYIQPEEVHEIHLLPVCE